MKSAKKLLLFISLAWRESRSYVLLLVADALVGGARLLANVMLPKYLIDSLIAGEKTADSLSWCGLLIVSNLLFAFLGKTLSRFISVRQEYVGNSFSRALGEKIMSLPFSRIEDPHCLDLRERAVFAVKNQSALENLISSSADMVKNSISVLTLSAVIFTLSPVFALAMLLTVAAMIFIQGWYSKYQVGFYESLLPVNRKYGYYVNLCFEGKGQKDYRLYGMSGMIGDRIAEYNREIARWFGKNMRMEGLCMGLYQAVTVLQTALAYGYVGLRCISLLPGGTISIGGLTMYVSAAVNFSSSVMALGQNVVTVVQMLSYLDPFYELMTMKEDGGSGGITLSEIESIEFDKIRFTYPGAEKEALTDVSFRISRGEKISIVGLNGAGKTTIVKLLCRLYDPDSGVIRINGRDMREYSSESCRKCVSAVFQDFKLLNYSIGENITCSGEGVDRQGAVSAAEEAGLSDSLSALPNGIDSYLGKAYDEEGIELSGGQMQKIAIARALYKNASLVILDEPTSALDPMAEAEIYSRFNGLIGGKTAIYISHRMSSSVFCDRILLLDSGRVADFDTHSALMKKNSLYAEMFNAQAENYRM